MAIYKNSRPFGNIVTEGLILNLDATNPASYPGTGTTWFDTSGNGRNGTLTNGPVYTVQGAQTNFTFDGTNDFTSLTTPAGINVGVFFTVQTWVRINRFGGGLGGGVFNRASIISNSYPYSSNQGFLIMASSQASAANGFIATPGREYFFISFGNDQFGRDTQTGSLTPYVNQWVNLAARVSGSALIQLYINGAEASYNDTPGFGNGPSSISYTNGPCSLGTRGSNNQEFLSGSIAHFQMYNRALSPAEISQNYNALKSRFGY